MVGTKSTSTAKITLRANGGSDKAVLGAIFSAVGSGRGVAGHRGGGFEAVELGRGIHLGGLVTRDNRLWPRTVVGGQGLAVAIGGVFLAGTHRVKVRTG